MRIPLKDFRNVIEHGSEEDNATFIEKMASIYGLDKMTALQRYNRIATAINEDYVQYVMCAWTDNIVAVYHSVVDHTGVVVSNNAASQYGKICLVCNNLYHISESDISNIANIGGRNGNVCNRCIRRTHMVRQNNVWYTSENEMTRLTQTVPTDWDNLTFSSTNDLYRSYESGRHDFPQVIGENIQHAMVNYSGNPLHYKEGFKFLPSEILPINPLWLGVELEVHPNPAGERTPGFFHKVATSLAKFAIMKPDGSLEQGGFEICSIPATLYAHKELWEEFFLKAAPLLRSWATGRYGMHVHMNKAFMTTSEVGRALVFINSKENAKFVELIAGRGPTNYTTYSPKRITDGKVSSTSHYDALSVSGHNNGKTLELRIFRGNVSKDGFFKNLEFTDALGHFVKDASMKALSSHDFIAWIAQAHIRGRYPYFMGWADKHNLFKDKKGVAMQKFSVPKTKELKFEDA